MLSACGITAISVEDGDFYAGVARDSGEHSAEEALERGGFVACSTWNTKVTTTGSVPRGTLFTNWITSGLRSTCFPTLAILAGRNRAQIRFLRCILWHAWPLLPTRCITGDHRPSLM